MPVLPASQSAETADGRIANRLGQPAALLLIRFDGAGSPDHQRVARVLFAGPAQARVDQFSATLDRDLWQLEPLGDIAREGDR